MKPLIRLVATFGEEGAEQVRLRCPIDTGLPCAVLPERAWLRLDLVPSGARTVRMLDGAALTRATAECAVATRFGASRITVMLGETSDGAILPAAHLQEFGLMLHPFSRTVMPMAQEA